MRQQLAQYRDKGEQALAPLKQWYQSREPREQKVLQLLAVVIALLLVWGLVWQPAWNVREAQQKQWLAQARMQQWMQANSTQVKAAQRSGNRTSAVQGDWVSALTRSATAASVTLKGFNPEGDDAVRIQLENQPFAATFNWLQSLSQQGVQVASAEFMPGTGTGRVNLRATLRRSL